MLYEAIKLILLAILFVSLIGLVMKAYALYTLGRSSFYLMSFFTSIQRSLFSSYTLVDVPVWKDSIYLFLYNTSLLDIVYSQRSKCYIFLKDSWVRCEQNPNYCANGLCICLVRISNIKNVISYLENQIITADGMAFKISKCCYNYPFALVFEPLFLNYNYKSLFLLPSSVLDYNILNEALKVSCSNKDLYISAINSYCSKVLGEKCFEMVSKDYKPKVGIYSQEIGRIIDIGAKLLTKFTIISKRIILTSTLKDNIMCVNVNAGKISRIINLRIIPILENVGCFEDKEKKFFSYPLIAAIYAIDKVYYVSENRNSYLTVGIKPLYLGNKVLLLFDIQNVVTK